MRIIFLSAGFQGSPVVSADAEIWVGKSRQPISSPVRDSYGLGLQWDLSWASPDCPFEPGRIMPGARAGYVWATMGLIFNWHYSIAEPVQILGGFVRAWAGRNGQIFAHAYPARAPGGICTGSCGLERAARAGPGQIPVQAQSNPACCPDWARTGQTGLARSNPARAPAGLAIWVLATAGLLATLCVQRGVIGLPSQKKKHRHFRTNTPIAETKRNSQQFDSQ